MSFAEIWTKFNGVGLVLLAFDVVKSLHLQRFLTNFMDQVSEQSVFTWVGLEVVGVRILKFELFSEVSDSMSWGFGVALADELKFRLTWVKHFDVTRLVVGIEKPTFLRSETLKEFTVGLGPCGICRSLISVENAQLEIICMQVQECVTFLESNQNHTLISTVDVYPNYSGIKRFVCCLSLLDFMRFEQSATRGVEAWHWQFSQFYDSLSVGN